jgi:serine/threonine protein kinase
VTRVVCSRHPDAAVHRGFCPACLFEEALAPAEASVAPIPSFTIQVPLGERPAGAVFLVRTHEPSSRLLRLKTSRTEAPDGFVERFVDLHAPLAAWSNPAIVYPLTAWIDAGGHPCVLTEFRQGIPLLDRVRGGYLRPARAVTLLEDLREVVRAGHRLHLVHGSIGPGNILVNTADGSACLLDFGLAALIAPPGARPPRRADDEAGFDSLLLALHQPGSTAAPAL